MLDTEAQSSKYKSQDYAEICIQEFQQEDEDDVLQKLAQNDDANQASTSSQYVEVRVVDMSNFGEAIADCDAIADKNQQNYEIQYTTQFDEETEINAAQTYSQS